MKSLWYKLSRMTPAQVAASGLWRLTLCAAACRRRLLPNVTFVGVTGSVGKTTVKDLLAAALSPRGAVVRNPESVNRNGGVSMTLLRTTRRHRFCVQELAARGPGTLDGLVRAFKPDVAVVTHIQRDHYAAFRGREGAALEKGKLVAALPPGGLAVLNADDPLVLAMAKRTRARVVTYGLGEGAEVRAEKIRADWPGRLRGEILIGGRRFPFQTQLCGTHWVHLVLAATAAAAALGVPPEEALAAIEHVPPMHGRMRPHVAGPDITFIEDYWKGSLDSFEPALDFMCRASAPRKIVIIGHISDYPGKASSKYIGMVKRALEFAEFVGLANPLALSLAPKCPPGRVAAFTSVRDLDALLHTLLRPGDLVLLKGSGRVDHLERLVLSWKPAGVACWREHCRLTGCCATCPKRLRPAGSSPPRWMRARRGASENGSS